MRPVQRSVRLPISLDKTLRMLAERHGISTYAMLQRSVKAGVAALANPSPTATGNQEIVAELASVSTRQADIERTLDRALYVACAAYCYARSAALGGGKTDEIILTEIVRAYDRQTAVADGTES